MSIIIYPSEPCLLPVTFPNNPLEIYNKDYADIEEVLICFKNKVTEPENTYLVKYLKEQSAEIQKLRNKIYEVEINLVKYKTAMAMHVHTGFGLGVVQTVPGASCVTEAAKSIPEFLETTTSSIIETYNTKIKEWAAFGVEDGVIKGAPDTKLLSDTVFIGR